MSIERWALVQLTLAGILAGVVPGAATADVTLDASTRRASGQLFVVDSTSVKLNLLEGDTTHETSDYRATGFIGTNDPNLGYVGTANAALDSGFVPAEPGLGMPFNGFRIPEAFVFSSATHSDSPFSSQTNAFSTVFFDFTLTVPTKWKWSAIVEGSVEGTGENSLNVSFIDLEGNLPDFGGQYLSGTFSPTEVVTDGLLPAGQWQLFVSLSATNEIATPTGSGSAYMFLENGFLTFTSVPEPSTFVMGFAGLCGLWFVARRSGRSA